VQRRRRPQRHRKRPCAPRATLYTRLDKAPISATTVFNGAFAELLTGQMPMVSARLRRVLYWGDGDQRLDFTTMDDAAAFSKRRRR
jgi:nucleoside-diphosphate-sugar epimerase